MPDRPTPHLDDRLNVEINLGKLCNSRCVFCLDGNPPRDRRRLMSLEALCREIDLYGDRGYRSLGLLGGEPTLHPGLPEAIRRARVRGFTRITIATNGMRLADRTLTDRLLEAGLTRVTLSLHGHTEALEDGQTRIRGSFRRKVSALQHLVRRRDEGALRDGLSVNLVLNRRNLPHLLSIQRFLHEALRIDDLRINFIRAEGNAAGDRELTPTFTEAIPRVMKAVALNELRFQRTLTLGGFPLCVFPRAFLTSAELTLRYLGERHDLATDCSIRAEGALPGRPVVDERARFNWRERKVDQLKARTEACASCAAAPGCEGVWVAYLAIHGPSEFHPAPVPDGGGGRQEDVPGQRSR